MPTLSAKYKGYTVRSVYKLTQSGTKTTITADHYLDCASGWDLHISARDNTCTIAGAVTPVAAFRSAAIDTNGGTTHKLGSTTHVIQHNADGTPAAVTLTTVFNLKGTISGVYKANITVTGTIDIPKIVRAATLSVPNGTLNVGQTITIVRPTSGVPCTVSYIVGGDEYTIATKTTAATITFTPPLATARYSPSGGNVVYTWRCVTYSDGNVIGTADTTAQYAVPKGLNPSCVLAVGDQLGFTEMYGYMIQGKSQINAVIEPTINQYTRAPIVAYSLTIHGRTFSPVNGFYLADTAVSWSGTEKLTATVTDAHGNTATATYELTILPYANPSPRLTARRTTANGTADDQGEYITATYNANYSSMNGLNSVKCVLLYKSASATKYTTVAATADGTYTFPADTGSTFEVIYRVTDDFITVDRAQNISTAETIMHISVDGALAFGKVSERPNMDEHARSGGDVFYNGIYDKFILPLRNGLSFYEASGGTDANTTLEEIFLSTNNTPNNRFYYVRQMFYSTKSVTARRTQYAVPYNHTGGIKYRYFDGTAWSAWIGAENTALVNVGDGYGQIKDNNGHLIQWGKVVITPTAGVVVSQQINFPYAFKYTPNVTAAPQISVPQVITWGVGQGTTVAAGLTSMIIYLQRSNAVNTTFHWRAEGIAND